jgi:hypothetical protein
MAIVSRMRLGRGRRQEAEQHERPDAQRGEDHRQVVDHAMSKAKPMPKIRTAKAWRKTRRRQPRTRQGLE